MDSNRHTNTPLRQLYLLPQWKAKLVTTHPKLTEALLILPPVVVDTGYMSLHINYVSQQGMQGENARLFASLHARIRCLFACMCYFSFFPGKICECVYLFRSLCACVFVFESSNVSEILQPCFIQWEVRGSSFNSSPNALNELFWNDGCHALSPAVPSAATAIVVPAAPAPHSPASLSQLPTDSLPSHHPPHCHHGNCIHTHSHIQLVREVR